MPDSIAFDRAADFYDETRGFPAGEAVPVGVLLNRVGQFGAADRILEIGIGTGRIALPMAAHVNAIYGIDLSRPMMARLRHKQQGERIYLTEADATRLPFADASFDGALAVHVFHLIPDWRQAVAEVARVLKPGAPLVSGRTENFHRPLWWETWDAWLDAVPGRRGNVGITFDQHRTFLHNLGWTPRGDEQAYAYTTQITPRQFLDQIGRRIWSSTWQLPEAELQEGIETLRAVMVGEGIDFDAPIENTSHVYAQAFVPPR